MDGHSLSQLFGYAGLALKVSSSFMPDAQRIRFLRIPSLVLGGLSFQTDGQASAAALNYTASIRTAIRATKTGAENKRKLLAAGLIPVAVATAIEYQQPIDSIPMVISTLGGAADFTSQGRYQRAIITIAGVNAIGYCLAKGNTAMAISSLFSTITSAYSAMKYDIRGAAGTAKPNLLKDLRAYWYGLRHDAPTAANVMGQVAVGESPLSEDELYLEKLQTKINPHMDAQDGFIMILENQIDDAALQHQHSYEDDGLYPDHRIMDFRTPPTTQEPAF